MPAPALPVLDFELLFAALPAPVAVLAPDGTVLALNAALTALLGAENPAAVVGQPLAGLLTALAASGQALAPPATWAAGLLPNQLTNIQSLTPVWTSEARSAVAGPLDPTYWEAALQPVHAPGGAGPAAGELRYLLMRLQDVSEQLRTAHRHEVLEHERQRREALLAEAQAADQRLHRVTESLPSITFISDQEGQVLYLSPQWYAYTGCSPADDLTQEWQTRLHPDDRAWVQEQYAAALATGTPWRYERRLRRHDGAYRWFTSQGVPEPLEVAQAAGRSRQWFGSDLDVHELRETQRRLEAKDQQLSQILSQSPALIATLEGPEHRFAFTNPSYDALVGHRARLGQPVAECLPELEEQGFVALLDGVYQTGEPFRGHERPIALYDPATDQWQQSYLDFTYQALRNGSRQVTGILVFVVDVSQQVQARREADALQAEVQAADQRLRHQAAALPIITFTTDATGRTTYISPQWYAFTGQTPGGPWAEVDAAWAECLHPDDRANAERQIQQSINGPQLGRVEVRLRGANGQYRWFLTEAVPELDAAGQLQRRYGFMLDVHELRDTQRRLEDTDRHLSQILDQAPAFVATLEGPDHCYSFFNPGYAALAGHRVRLGVPVAECLPELQDQGFLGLLDSVYRTGEPHVGREVPIRLRNADQAPGREMYVDLTYTPLRDGQGQVNGILSFSLDVTARVRARHQAEKLAVEINRRDEQVRAITASVPVFIFNFNPAGSITYTNPYFYEYTGLDPARPPNVAWDVLPPDDRAAVAAVAQAAMARGMPWQATFRVRRRNGELRWFQAKAQPYADAGGQLAGFSAATVEIHELHARTEELARSRTDFAALADNIAQLAWMADPTGAIFWYNQQWYDYTGTTPDAMAGFGWQQVHDPELLAGINQHYLACIRAGEPWEDTFPLRRHDGQHRWFLSRARPIRDAATGAVARWFGTNTDVTELRELQTQLGASEEELRIQAESIPQQVWTARPDGTVDFYNHRTAAYVGEAMERNGAAHWLSFVHPDDRPAMHGRWSQAIDTQRYYEAEFRLRRYDGEYRWFLGQAQARRVPGGQVVKWYGTNTDVHQQRVLQDELVSSQARFEQLLETLPQMAWTARPDGHVNYYNQRWYNYTGATFEQLRDWGWEEFMHPDDLPGAVQRWRHSLTTGEPFENEHRWRDLRGHYRWFLARGEAVLDSSGAVAVWVGANTDVHEFKQVQQQLEAQNARLVRTNEDLDNFVYTASHDLKQPINNMAGIFEELTRTAYFRDPDAIKLITYFERALAQIFGTIDDLGAIVRGQRQQQELPAEDVALAPLVDKIIGSLQDQVTQSGATLDLDFATCPVVTFVRPNLQSLLFNLLSNSLKYAAPGRPPRIRISSAPDVTTGRPILAVQDNGVGIDMERFGPQLFQLFRRFHTHVEGTGMGLYLVNRIVQNHGGRLEVTSVVGEGTTFQVHL